MSTINKPEETASPSKIVHSEKKIFDNAIFMASPLVLNEKFFELNS